MPNIRVVRTNTTVDVAAIGRQCASGNNNGAAMLNAEKVVLVNIYEYRVPGSIY